MTNMAVSVHETTARRKGQNAASGAGSRPASSRLKTHDIGDQESIMALSDPTISRPRGDNEKPRPGAIFRPRAPLRRSAPGLPDRALAVDRVRQLAADPTGSSPAVSRRERQHRVDVGH